MIAPPDYARNRLWLEACADVRRLANELRALSKDLIKSSRFFAAGREYLTAKNRVRDLYDDMTGRPRRPPLMSVLASEWALKPRREKRAR